MITPVPGSTLAGTLGHIHLDPGSRRFPILAMLRKHARRPTTWASHCPTGTSYTATLPVTGATLYVRLWSLIGGQWQYIDYTYTEANLGAKMVSPTPGTTLSGTSITFTWTTGTGVTQYGLFFGSTPGGLDLGLAWPSGTSQMVTLPVTGATLYVRLWSMIGGAWQYVDYTYVH